MPASPGMVVLASFLAGSRDVDLFASSEIFGLVAVLGVGVSGDGGSAMFRLGGRRISFPSLDFAGLSRSARNNTT
jgi:hypothetical protein